MSKLFGSCCHRQPNSRVWAKETAPCVSDPASVKAGELSLRIGSVSEASPAKEGIRPLNKYHVLSQPRSSLCWHTDRPLISIEWWLKHSWAKIIARDSCITAEIYQDQRIVLTSTFPKKESRMFPYTIELEMESRDMVKPGSISLNYAVYIRQL